MCGITGIIKKTGLLQDRSLIKQMTDAIQHRGPDAEGIWAEEKIAFGHRRLAIIDLSEESNQPFFDVSGRYVMVFNGEIYNFQSIKAKLTNYPFTTQSDTEVILAAYIEWGEKCVELFNGMFALAIWDKQSKRLFCARDRLGIKPLYYVQNDEYFLFASELRALLAANLFKPKLNKTNLINFLQYQTVNGSGTIIQNIFQLKAGHWAIYENGILKAERFWAMQDVEEIKSNKKEVKKNVKELMLKAVERRMISDVPFGAFLSGGIDSSAIVACMATVSNQPVNTFSVGFNEKKFDESKYAEIIAKKYNTRHTNIKLDPNRFLKEVPNILDSMDRPSGDGPNTFMVSKMTKEAGITVALSGLGGDELFAGYSTFNTYLKFQNNKSFWMLPTFIRKNIGSLLTQIKKDNTSQKLARALSLPNINFEKIYPLFRKAFSNKEIQFLLKKFPSISVLNSLWDEGDIHKINNLPLLSQISVGEIDFYTRDLLLRDTDQMSMAHALEVRVPFFDHELVEYALTIPDSIKKPSYPKELLVDSISPMLPDEIVHRPKMGFTLPWEYWLKNELNSLCETNLKYLIDINLFSNNLLEYWNRFLKGDKTIPWSRIWQLTVLGHWLQKNKVQ